MPDESASERENAAVRCWAESGLFIDIEAVPGGEIFGLGVTFGRSLRREALSKREVVKLARELETLAGRATFIGGHNILAHDLPVLDAAFGVPELKRLPVVDTLCLSPLAFPRNPYHRLTKNDRLARSSKNHPARDCESSLSILEDCLTEFGSMLRSPPAAERLGLMRWLLGRAALPWNGSLGFEKVFSELGAAAISSDEAAAAWARQVNGSACPEAARGEWARLSDPGHGASLAYVLAWLPVAGSDSVLPGWVRHRFPETTSAIRRLRGTPCRDAGCPWCKERHSPTGQLQRFFGYPQFRAEPAVSDRPGVSLQEEIVRQAMGGASVMGILPTGGGKSLCFQVPALHKYVTTGALTIVLTPLQALMKDQVDGLIQKTSMSCVASLNGMQTPPEKAEVREAVRLGSVGILYVSPEQVRNSSFRRTILQREIGCWVFDEAHCLSQWGHDFRPDYVYVARFIRELAEEQGVPVPPVMCMTATAKEDVKAEIVRHFEKELGLSMVVLDGGTARDNLRYRIEKVTETEKLSRVDALLGETIGNGLGAAVVFVASRKRAKNYSDLLASKQFGWSCAAFHAGLSAEEKKSILDDFLSGRIQVVVATNAFGMGIDKPNIRLVVHVDTPGSLESYLQEAGRAGRDRDPAECVLLYNPEDLETQFGMVARSKVDKRDIDNIWRAIRRADRGDDKPVTLTVPEILKEASEAMSFAEEPDEMRDAKVRTAIAVLEKQGFLKRDENQTRVFQARALLTDEEAIRKRLEQLDLSESKRELWFAVMRLLLDEGQEVPLRLDDFAELPRMKELYDQMRKGSYSRVSPFAPVFQVLNEMAQPEIGLISKDLLFSAWLHAGRTGSAAQRLRDVAKAELDLLEMLREGEPSPEGYTPLNLRLANQRLVERGHVTLPQDLVRMLKTLASDGRKMGRPSGLLEAAARSRDVAMLRVDGNWSDILEDSAVRRDASAILVDLLLRKAKAGTATESARVLVEFSEAEVIEAFKGDMTVSRVLGFELTSFVQYLLVYLHDSEVFELKNGKALISQAMNLRVIEKTKGKDWRRFTKGDYATLLVHYSEKYFQVHVMGAYANLGVERLGAHMRLLLAYFALGKADFAAKFLREDPEVYQRATGLESFRRIVEDLRNPLQQAIVAEPSGSNMLVLAGPGSGKTRVVAHRCAYLLRVERVRPERILVACFNRHAALQLRRQIFRLVGKEAFGVMVQTYHGLALRLLGRSLAGREDGDGLPDFAKLLEDATALLTGADPQAATGGEELRDRILAGFSHILVDEYQDVDEREYAFISAIAGRREADEDRKLAIMAVGDDDQSIYGFKGANVRFIRQFKQDYRANEHYLIENYRSTGAIISAANRLVARNADRMKIAHPIRINGARAAEPAGGVWEAKDTIARGRVQRVVVQDARQQAVFVVSEIQRLRALAPEQPWAAFAIIGRTRAELVTVRAALDDAGLPIDWQAEDEMPVSPFAIREVDSWLSLLDEKKHEFWDSSAARTCLAALRGESPSNRWWRLLEDVLAEWIYEVGESQVPVTLVKDFFIEAVAERRRHHRIGDGVVLVTAHKAKGLEFPHVFIADGGWRNGQSEKETEEERRVFYVAMTRARETLSVIMRRDRRTRFCEELAGPDVLQRSLRQFDSGPDGLDLRQYSVIGPKELFISWASAMTEGSLVHANLRESQVGDEVRIVSHGRWIHVETKSGVPIAALSEAGRSAWGARLSCIKKATITAIVRRTNDQTAEAYRAKACVQRWEIPIVEVCWHAQTECR